MKGYIGEGGGIGGDAAETPATRFSWFFSFLDKHLVQERPDTIIGQADSAKGISFLPVIRAIIEKKRLEIGINSGSANTIRLTARNFAFPFSHGIAKGQNFGFVIFFDIKDIKDKDGKRVVEKGYSKEYLECLQTASPDLAREYVEHDVMRVEGYLDWDRIAHIGFRYRDKTGQFAVRCYKLSASRRLWQPGRHPRREAATASSMER